MRISRFAVTARAVALVVAIGRSVSAQVAPLPAGFRVQEIPTNGTSLHVRHFVLIDAPLPGIGPWDAIKADHKVWHFSFWGPDEDRLVAGRERIYLDRLWNEFSADPKKFDDATRAHYAAIYAKPGRMHAGFEQFHAFDQDATDNKAFVAKGLLTMPVLALGGDHSFGPMMATVMRAAASNVTQGIVPNSGHWIMEENPTATIALVTGFLAK